MADAPVNASSSLDDPAQLLGIQKNDLFTKFSASSSNPYLRCHRKLVPLSEFLDYHEQEKQKAAELKSPVMTSAPHHLSTGVPSMDALFKGGLQLGQISEFYGESGTGKTQLCLQLCIYAALDPPFGLGARSLYISTQKAANEERLAQLLRLICSRHRADEDVITQRIMIKHVQNESLKSILSNRTRLYGVKVICVDNVASLCDQFQYQDEYGNQRVDFIKRSEYLLTTAGALKSVACELQAAIVVTNNVSSKFDQQVEQEDQLDLGDQGRQGVDKLQIQETKGQAPFEFATSDNYLWNLDQPQKWNQSKIGNYIKKIVPKLGVLWSNCVNARIQLVKHTKGLDQNVLFRFLKVEFCSYVATGAYVRFVISDSGIMEYVERRDFTPSIKILNTER